MGVPTWLSSDPIEARAQPRTRPGWSPRPRNRVKILNAWDVPEGVGSGADDNPPMFLNPATGSYEPIRQLDPGAVLAAQAGDSVAPVSYSTQDTATTQPLTAASSSVINPSKSVVSTTPTQTGTGRSVLPSSSPTQSRARVVSGPSGSPPQGPSSAPAVGSRQQQFLAQAVPAAKQAEAQTGIPWQVYVGIAANETGWGSSVVGNNYFGIKGSNPTTGANTGSVGTWEVVNGQRVNINDTFRAYGSPEESFADFGNFLKSNPRYASALNYLKANPDDWRGFTRMLNEAGYATDPDWASKVISIGNNATDTHDNTAAPKSQIGPDASGVKGIQSVIDMGSTQIGSKYQWGGAGGRSNFAADMAPTDCSGFVSWAYNRATGVSLPAQTSSMWQATTQISADKAMPGDLVFYNHGQGADMEHVGIYTGHGMMLHDSSLNPNGGVDVTPLWGDPVFRRVGGVDPSIIDDSQPNALVDSQGQPASKSYAPLTSPDLWEDWTETVHNGRKLWVGHTHSGLEAKHDFGAAPEGSQEGAVIGSGQEEGDDEGDDTDYSFLDTPLSPQGEAAFQIWKAKYAPRDSGFDYDLRGAYAAGLKPDPQSGHWPDTYKKPNHPTFSDQSKFAKDYPDKAGHWDGETYYKPSFLNPSTGDYDPLKSGVGAGGEGGMGAGDNWYDDPAVVDPRSQVPGRGYDIPTNADVINAGGADAVVAAQQTPGGGYQVPTNADVANAQRAAATAASPPTPGPEEVAPAAPTALPKRNVPTTPAYTGPTVSGLIGTAATNAKNAIDAAAQAPGGVGAALNKTAAGAIGVAADALGSAANTVGGAISTNLQDTEAAAEAARQQPPPVERHPTVAQAVTSSTQSELEHPQTVEDTAAGAQQAITDTAASVAQAGQNVVSAASQVPDAAERAARSVVTGANQAVTNQAQATSQALQADADVIAHPETAGDWYSQRVAPVQQNLLVTGGTANPASTVASTIPGLVESAQWMKDHGYDWQPVQDKLDNLYDPNKDGTFAQQVVADASQPGGMNPVQAAQMGMGYLNGLNDVRTEMVAQAQSPEIRQSPEGQTVQQAIAMASDPTMYIGTPLLSRGKFLVEGGKVAEDAVRAAKLAHAAQGVVPEVTDLIRLSRPLEEDATRDVFQRAAIQFNDPALDVGKAVGRYEPLSGEQVRRALIDSAARADPNATVSQVLDRVDGILHQSGLPELTTDQAAMLASKIPETVRAARSAWYKTDVGRAAAQFERDWGETLKQQQAGYATTGMALRTSTGAGAGYVWGQTTEDPNDPYHDEKVAAKTIAGAGAALGVPWAAGLVRRGAAKLGEVGAAFYAPTENLGKAGIARDAIQQWEGQHRLGGALGQMFTDRTRAIFGDAMDTDMAAYIERTGKLPPAYNGNKAAQDWLSDWKAITQWAVKYDIVPGDVTMAKGPGAPALYVPHVLDKDYTQALKLGRADASRGRITGNPFSQYQKPRSFQTLDQGLAAGQEYVKDYASVYGDYYDRAIQMQAREGLANELRTLGQSHNVTMYGPSILPDVLRDLDAIHVPQGQPYIQNTNNLAKYFPTIRENEGLYGSNELSTVLDNLFGSGRQGLAGALNLPKQVLYPTQEINGFLKHNTLSGSAFHLVNEIRQFVAANGFNAFMPNVWMNGVKMMTPGGARQFWSDPVVRSTAERAIRNGLTLDMSADRPLMDTTTRLLTAAFNTAGGALTGYASAGATGGTQEDQFRSALTGGALGLAASTPMIPGAKQLQSPIEALSHAMWDRIIPYMKYTTFSMYDAAQAGRNPRAVASYVNALFGGNNALAVGRSQVSQDLARMFALAPDWQESWARLIGNAAFGWGPNAPVGDMARSYWKNAAFQSALLLEGMNLALGGHSFWENDPDAITLVDASKFYDDHGWNHTDPRTGQTYKPYIDVLGPYRGMLEPVIQSARWATAQAIEKAGYKPGVQSIAPLSDAIFGKFGDNPEPDPATAWKGFVGSRASFLLSTPAEVWGDKDFAGRSYADPGDPAWKIMAGQISRAMQHAQPTGVTQYLQNTVRGDPAPIAALSAVTGLRVRHETETNKYFDFLDQYTKQWGKGPEDYATLVANARRENMVIDGNIDALQTNKPVTIDGRLYNTPTLTARDRDKLINDQAQQRSAFRVRHILQDLPADRTLSAQDQQDQKAQLDWLTRQNPIVGGQDPADLLTNRPDLDPDEILRQAWNRDPYELARTAGTLPKPTDPITDFTQQLNEALTNGPGHQPAKAVADLRNRWMTDTAEQWGLDRAALEDYIKARVYTNSTPDQLPGLKSADLDRIVQGYMDAGRDLPADATGTDAAVIARTNYLQSQASAAGVDYNALANRVRLRTVPLTDQSSGGQSRFNALTVQANSKAYPYTNPDGTPFQGVTDPNTWKQWDNKLAANADRRFPNGIYVNPQKTGPDDALNQLQAAKDAGRAQRYKDVLNSPNFNDYYRWFGDGQDMTDDQWQQYQNGTLDMYNDKPPPSEALQRRDALRVAQALTKQEQIDYTDFSKGRPPVSWLADYGDGRGPHVESGTLTQYLSYIRHHQRPAYKDVGADVLEGVP